MVQKISTNWLFILFLLVSAVIVMMVIMKSERYSGMIRTKIGGPMPVDTRIQNSSSALELPAPSFKSGVSLEEALLGRRSHRSYLDSAISQEELSQILWAAYGITQPSSDPEQQRGGKRTAPSSGAFYPLEIYAVVGKVDGVESGVYKYVAMGHKLVKVIDGDLRSELCKAAYKQPMVEQAPMSLLYSAVFERTTRRFGERGRTRYVCAELGHSAQNVYLQVQALGLGTCVAGAFTDADVKKVMLLPAEEEPLYIMPIGRLK